MQEDLQRVRRAAAVTAALAAAPAFAAGVRIQRHLRPWLVLVQAEHAICNVLGQWDILQKVKVKCKKTCGLCD
eukprot:scaffold33046_cov56-Phaeocystis_antarctica.AAC.2